MVAWRELATRLDRTTLAWDDLYAMDVASDGSLVLLLGWETSWDRIPPSPTIFRAAVLQFRPIPVGRQ